MSSSSSSVLMLSGADIGVTLDSLSAQNIMSSVGRALHTFSHASANPDESQDTPLVQNPLRLNILTPAHNVLFMPSRLGSEKTTSIKVVSVPRDANDKSGLPATTLVFDERTGQVRACMNARALTAVRTAAASALSVQLSPTSSSFSTLLVFGTGLQALWHARLVSDLSANIKHVCIACRAPESTRARHMQTLLSKYFTSTGKTVEVALMSIEEAVKQQGVLEKADVVCCCTPVTSPLFSAGRLKNGCSLTMIGSYKPHMQEVELSPLFDTERSRSTRIVVDSRVACLAEAGELYRLRDEKPELFAAGPSLLHELGSLVDADGAVRDCSGDAINVFKCVGLGVMDAAISALVLAKAEELGLGTRVPF